jgi:glycosyltransferase EpsF
MIRILHILPGLGAAGAEIFVRNLCLGLQKEPELRQEIVIATTPPQFFEPELTAAGIAIHRVAEFSATPRGLAGYIRGLWKLLRRERYDIVHCHMDYFNAVNACVARLAGVRHRVCHAHIAGSRAQRLSLPVRAYHTAMRLGLRLFATRRLACSNEAARAMFPWTQDVEIIPNGIELQKFIKATPALLNLPARARVVITVAGYREPKNPLFLLDVIAAAARKEPEILLLWCGSGGLQAQIEARIAALGIEKNVRLLGNRADVAALLKRAQCFVLPSKWEGFGIALVEAQAAGVPSLASVFVPRSTDCGLAQYLPLEVQRWTEELLRVLHADFCKKPDAQKLNRYDIAVTCRAIVAVYEGLAGAL